MGLGPQRWECRERGSLGRPLTSLHRKTVWIPRGVAAGTGDVPGPMHPELSLQPHGEEALLSGSVQSLTSLDFAPFMMCTDSPSK